MAFVSTKKFTVYVAYDVCIRWDWFGWVFMPLPSNRALTRITATTSIGNAHINVYLLHISQAI